MINESEFTDEYVLKLQKELDYENNYNIYLIAKLDKIKEYCMNDRNFVVPDEYTQKITDGIQDEILELLEEIE